ncbi:hypothetical protein [Paraburkholderia dinghuensis]|uniref:Pilus assembly protein n=1 Tax=Paraburkholderia dinghuensis TaxID=2305225 RepID=A0A3N6P439_9BURK|nr:hypothetical protein [Paraburkholderia dinghuensis]RQH08383.1 hypothetical protein D1Y85_05040 [Paraburkholderia dinghuensis]
MKPETVFLARRAALVAVACAALGGCMSSSPVWDKHFGEAARTTAQVQIINPHAGEDAPSPQSIDGNAAVSAMELYDKSYKSPPAQANPFAIGVSGGSGGGGGTSQ